VISGIEKMSAARQRSSTPASYWVWKPTVTRALSWKSPCGLEGSRFVLSLPGEQIGGAGRPGPGTARCFRPVELLLLPTPGRAGSDGPVTALSTVRQLNGMGSDLAPRHQRWGNADDMVAVVPSPADPRELLGAHACRTQQHLAETGHDD